MLSLRDYQADGIGKIRAAFQRGSRSVLYVLPTGGGKTVIFSSIAHATIARNNKRVLILVHRIELLKQASAALKRAGVPHGLINPNYRLNLTASVQVASVQTLANRLHKIPFTPDLIIVDEAHHSAANTWKKVYNHYPNALLLGVTATPIRLNGQGLGRLVGGYFDDLVIGPQINELISRGHLVKPVVYAAVEKLNLDDINIDSARGDYNIKELAAAVDKPVVTGSAVDEYRRLCPGQSTVVFCISVAHAEHVAAEFRAAGFAFYAVDGNMDDAKRERYINGLGDGTVQGICSCDIISEGTDIPAVSCEIFLRPTQSLGLYIQQGGRGLRPAPGKTFCIVLDHAGNTLRHGMLDEARHWTLDGEVKKKKKKRGIQLPQSGGGSRYHECTKCHLVHPTAPFCPGCGFSFINPEDYKTKPGELQQITEQHIKYIKRLRAREVSEARTTEDLEMIAAARGYKPGWAKHIIEARANKNN